MDLRVVMANRPIAGVSMAKATTSISNKRVVVFSAMTALIAAVTGWLILRPEDPVALLARELQSEDFEVRYDAAKALEDMGPNAAGAVAQLSGALGDEELKVRYRAAKALSKMGPLAVSAVPSLAGALGDPDTDVRYYAAKALYKIDEDAEMALDSILAALEKPEPDAEVRRYLIKSLEEIGEGDDRARSLVKKFANDRDPRVRESVAAALDEFEETR